jgi:hypothetical protein
MALRAVKDCFALEDKIEFSFLTRNLMVALLSLV